MTPQTDNFIRSNTDKTAAEIVSALQTLSPTTVNPIPLATLEAFLNSRGLLEQVKLVAENVQTPLDVAIGLKSFLDHLSSPRQNNLDTTDPIIAVITATVLVGLEGLTIATPDQVAEIYGMGGGLAYDIPSESDVQVLLDALGAASAQQALEQRITAAYNAAINLAQSGETDAVKIQGAFDTTFGV